MKLLIVEDEARMSRVLRRGLVEDGHTVDACATGAEARQSTEHTDYDVIILDWGLPDEDGISILRSWRAEGLTTPILMLTARGSSGEKVLGLKAGADDYLVKPFDFEELVARLEALHRRATGAGGGVSVLGDLKFLHGRRAIEGPVASLELTGREFQLFAALAERVGDVRTRSELLSQVWGTHFDGDPNVVDVYVSYLRSKIERTGSKSISIATVRGLGYRLVNNTAGTAS